ncbi:MAG: hypothetical protein AAGJ95_13975 [Cyanobacteria bacterium J06554_11]
MMTYRRWASMSHAAATKEMDFAYFAGFYHNNYRIKRNGRVLFEGTPRQIRDWLIQWGLLEAPRQGMNR